MKKNLYRKPYMVIGQFAPNAYVADCWYVAEGDCYSNLFEDNIVGNRLGRYDYGEYVAEGHESHRIPSSGYLNSEQYPIPEQSKEYPFYIPGSNFDIYKLDNTTTYTTTNFFEPVNTPVYKFLHEGITHYLKNISYPQDRNKS